MSETLKYTVKGQNLYPQSVKVVADSQGYLKCHFTFSDDWAGTSKYVQFKRGKDLFYDDALDNNNEVMVPWEVLVDEGVIRMNVYGAQNNPNVLIPTHDVEIIVTASGLEADQLPKTHTPGILGSALQRAIDAITSAGESALAAIQSLVNSAASDAAEAATQDVHDTLSGYVTDTTNAKADAIAAAELAEKWANKTDDEVADSEYSAKYYAMRAKQSADSATSAAESAATDAAEQAAASAATTAAQAAVDAAAVELTGYKNAAVASATSAANALTDAENFAVSETAFTKVTDLEDETEYYSAKHYADAAADSATAASGSAGTASDKALEASGSATAAQNWAIKTDGAVDSGEYSAKYYAEKASQYATNSSNAAGNAEQYAGNAHTSETNAANSATLAQNWATKTGSTVDGEEYSAKYYAGKAAEKVDEIAEAASSAATTAAQAAATAAATTAAQTAAAQAAPAAAEAVRSELVGYVNLAKDWASKAANSTVGETDEYSAKHYALAASASATAAAEDAAAVAGANPFKAISISGTTITMTKLDNTTATATTQDTTYTAGNGIEIDDQNSNAIKVKASTNVTVDSNGVSVTGGGSVASGNTGLISGGTLYTENRVANNGNYILAANSAAANLSALDTRAKTNADAIGSLSADGNYIKKSATKNVSENLDILDSSLKAVDDSKAESDAGNVGVNASTDNSEDWGDAIGGGSVASGNKKLVTGGTVFTETRVSSNGNYTLAANTAAQNIAALDSQVHTNTTAIAGETTNRQNAIGSLSANGNYIKKSSTKNVCENLSLLDTQVKTNADAIAGKATAATTLSGYGITDAYTKTEVDTALSGKAATATTLSGYGITDAYTKTETDSAITSETRLSSNGNYVLAANTAKANISALDTQVKSNADEIATIKGRPYMYYNAQGHLMIKYNRSNS